MPRQNVYALLIVVVTCIACALRADPASKTLSFVLSEIQARALEPVSRHDLAEAALDAMARRLDRNSAYVPQVRQSDFEYELDPKVVGIGVQIFYDVEADEVLIISPVSGSPAAEAGLLAGDRIVAVDGNDLAGMEFEDVGERIRGEPGTEVALTIERPGDEAPRDVTVTRQEVQQETVIGDRRAPDGTWNYVIDDEHDIAYVRVTTFAEATASELRTTLEALLDQGMHGLVLDLRDDRGGLLRSAVAICDLFLEEGTIVKTMRRDGSTRDHFIAGPSKTLPSFPMAILVNQETASASEIVAACLQDHGRAVVVGTRTFGKGTVQELIGLPPTYGVFKLTTASYWRPSGQDIHRHADADADDPWGVLPNDGLTLSLTDEQRRQLFIWRARRDTGGIGMDEPDEDELDADELTADAQLAMAIAAVIDMLEAMDGPNDEAEGE